MSAALAEATALVAREAACLDRRRWDEWLALWEPDAVLWVPAWKSEDTPTEDPERELSLLYYDGRQGLADRVWRVRSQRSVASTPLHRTAHAVTNLLVEAESPEAIEVTASWTCHVFSPKRKTQHVFFGRYDYRLRRRPDGARIARKTVTLMNDYIPTMLDFYCL